MKNTELINQLSQAINVNKTLIIIKLKVAGYDFKKSVGEQDGEVDEKIAEMLLNSLIPTDEEEETTEREVVEEIKEEIQPIEQQEDKRYTQLLTLFNSKKTPPSKIKDRAQLVEKVLDILIPKSNSDSRKGRVLKDKHKRAKVSQLIGDSTSRDQLSQDLIKYIDDCKMKASKR
ncbi:hypothetical protein [Empedobacter brevis]|uniref:hypothetical protein n=1 Tax=Empedobacter brevis TaxID=247 RepID=UPI0028AB8B8D|nr:hypothetical protein [Empedobacter brevis]